jgi:hypothetical protein
MSKKKHEKGGYLIDIRLFLFMESVYPDLVDIFESIRII